MAAHDTRVESANKAQSPSNAIVLDQRSHPGPNRIRVDRLAAVALWAADLEAALGKRVEVGRPWPFVRLPDYFLMPVEAIVVELGSGAGEATSADS